jgi:hypothetical protein
MVKWHDFVDPVPALIHAFVDCRELPFWTKKSIPDSFLRSVDKKEMDSSNSMIGRYTVHRHSPSRDAPSLYLVDFECIDSPAIGIPDVGCSPKFFIPYPSQSWLAKGMGFDDPKLLWGL